ncbi:hypothetical protein KHQ06_26310 [Nocardia tengchongensis]|uniref:Biotin-protein ligase N-terminal domain-containing protein n=1 Tax=Nocardia tengchongensis TaxID=2055889 RepID=A0ABX8CIN2_9NOCA|nr:BPL-N domain-containing protein [Nocardia tengchongensis]QVI19818.1 hypothetical protein KHQ06_26310 [Nocardia tengchongensis]
MRSKSVPGQWRTRLGLALAAACLLAGCAAEPGLDTRTAQELPVALVYRGPASCDGCPEAAADLLARSGRFTVKFTGPDSELPLDGATLATASVYVQPGGGDDVAHARRQMDPYAAAITDYVRSGGRYLGICMGGYLAGTVNGFALWPGEVEQYSDSPGAEIHTTADTVATVDWRNHNQQMYFQDGPFFAVPDSADPPQILARYRNGAAAAVVAPSGKGRIALVGPHPEAPESWYTEHHLDHTAADDRPGMDLITALTSR